MHKDILKKNSKTNFLRNNFKIDFLESKSKNLFIFVEIKIPILKLKINESTAYELSDIGYQVSTFFFELF